MGTVSPGHDLIVNATPAGGRCGWYHHALLVLKRLRRQTIGLAAGRSIPLRPTAEDGRTGERTWWEPVPGDAEP